MATLRQQIATNMLRVTRFRDLTKAVSTYRPNDDLEIIRRAYDFSLQNHTGQSRASGEPYVVHPLEVAMILADMKMDANAIAAGLLHDCVEDTSVTIVDVRKEFGEQVAHLVEGVTKISKIDFATREERQAENLRKMMLAMVDDVRVVLIKLADRLHNMRTLDALPPDRREKIARETLEIYGPIAHRLGMGKIRGELEDLAFRYVDPIAYQQVHDEVEQRRKKGEEFLQQIVGLIRDKLKENGIEARVESRIKRLFSIWQKLQRQRISVDQTYDLFAIRIITSSVNDCYAVLGMIHNQWRPVPGRIKDFIAMPRPNLYQSLHTTVIAENGNAFEVQIRTEDMHRMAEEGIAAHWKYKDGPISAKDEQRLSWLRQLVEWQRDISDPDEFLTTLKVDLYPEEVYTFTPKGKVVSPPARFHSHRFRVRRAHRSRARLRRRARQWAHGAYPPQAAQRRHRRNRHADRTQAEPRLALAVKSTRARQKIRHWLNIHQRERAIEIGDKLIEKEARKYRVTLKDIKTADYQRVASDMGLGKPDDLMAAIGYGKYSARQILARLAPASSQNSAHPEDETTGISSVVRRVFGGDNSAILVKGHDDLLVYRARCCNPIKGEDVVGYITRGKGVAVHSKNCPNVLNLMYEPERRIDVDWARKEAAAGSYAVKLTLFTDDRPGMMKQITAIISDENTNIQNMSARTGDRQANIDVTIDIEDVKHLERILAGLRKIPGVHDVQRVQKSN